jgi:predicted Fe-Mo cluster-binding NifX family protein
MKSLSLQHPRILTLPLTPAFWARRLFCRGGCGYFGVAGISQPRSERFRRSWHTSRPIHCQSGRSGCVSGDFGPNAYSVLNTGGVDMYLFGHAQTVREAVEHFKDGKLTLIGNRLRLNIVTIRKAHENHSCERQGRHGQDNHCHQSRVEPGGRWAYSCLSGWRCGSAQRALVSQARFRPEAEGCGNSDPAGG